MDKFRKALADFNFVQQYAKFLTAENRYETWDEACDRISDMHKSRFSDPAIHALIDNAMVFEKSKKILSSQRARQFGGEGILRKNWRIYNCTTSYCDRIRFFQEAFWLLLCGCGVGVSMHKDHVKLLPGLREELSNKTREVIIPDSIEGWADSVGQLIEFWVGATDEKPVFNFDEIRPKGAPISTGTTAPGPEPLRVALESIDKLLSSVHASESKALRPIHCFDILMHLSNAVLAGGQRRAACIVQFAIDDQEMLNSKTGTWYIDNAQRSRANISVIVDGDVSRNEFKNIFKSTKQFGEPGFIFVKSKNFVFNPCCEIGMVPMLIKDPAGNTVERYTIDMLDNQDKYKEMGYTYSSGWQACNLTEVNMSLCDSPRSFIDAVAAATALGTIQATYTNADYLGSISEQIVRRESLLGVSLTGMANNTELSYGSSYMSPTNWLTVAADKAVETNKEVAALLGIPQASRITCVKPSGNAAVLLGCASGIHPEYHYKYLRRVQVNANNEPAKYFKELNPLAVQDSVWSAPGTTDFSIIFPIEVLGRNDIVRKELTAELFIDRVLHVQKSWVLRGIAVDRVEGLTHNVSNTCIVADNDWLNVEDKLWANQGSLTGISLLGESGDYVYNQAPFQAVYEQHEIDAVEDEQLRQKMQDSLDLWNTLRQNWTDVDYTRLQKHFAMEAAHMEPACAGGACEFIAKV